MKRFTVLAQPYGCDHEVVVAECDTSPEEILKAVEGKALRQQVGSRTFFIKRYANPRIRENNQEGTRG
jgi:hypothetical protein